MAKPIMEVVLETYEGRKKSVEAVFDTASFHTLVRQDALPRGALVSSFPRPKQMALAARGRKFLVIGWTQLIFRIGNKRIFDAVWVAPELARGALVGAGTMQKWDISIVNANGHTRVRVGLDMRDREINEVL